MKIKPLYRNVVVRLDDPPKVKGSIVLPDSASEKNQYATGVVVAAGPGCQVAYLNNGLIEHRIEKPMVDIGQRVIMAAYNATRTLDVDDAKLIIAEEYMILGVIEE